MAAAPRVNAADFFSAEQWRSLSARSSWRGLWLVAHCWTIIAAAMWMGWYWPSTSPLALMVIGTRQLGFFILMHDGAHGLLHPNRRINDWVAHWLCLGNLHTYRPYHLQHHRYVQQSEDPDLVLSAPFPVTRGSLWRKVWRDLSGQTFFKQRFGPIVQSVKLRPVGISAITAAWPELRKQQRFFIGHALALGLFTLAGYGWVWLALWLLPQMTWLLLVYRIRNIAEHALIAQNQADPLRQARTTHAGWLERIFIAPYWVNYHCEHHLFTQLPCWQLPRAHALLRQRGATAAMEMQPGYLTVLRLASAA